MRAIIIEDSRLARVELKEQLSQFTDIELIAEAENAEAGIELIHQSHPDLLFLDIQLPGMDGFALLEKLDFLPQIIFTTAYDEYAVKSFEVNALDYLLKPITNDRLQGAIDKARQQFKSAAISPDQTLQPNSRFFVKEKEQCWLVELQQVQLFESIGNYTRLYFEQHKPMIYKSLNQIESRLPIGNFFRANRTELINMQYVKNVEMVLNGHLLISLENGKIIELSRRRATEFKKQMSL
ncbi:LytTR family DNA-binding domain-containing protein [Paraglaciecola aquimarina]|uniref:LytTR family DNA-binding domain-containing protein n=1 Tax=Paraglaciecola algarum TaxID=3050085 RepID=A0ABS9DAN5_9ALTE|nr:LytTR family DNA-binding domain-containing protein [Paraglaciecola sp. G1-23]MCF2949087.1 LytTR family DNA-binding domain-containing protein [Paraglaciecola sp. G1-23]